MGSAPSTPTHEGSTDPWWTIENQNLDLNPATASGTDPMDHLRDAVDERRGRGVDRRPSEVQSSGSESSATVEVDEVVSVDVPLAAAIEAAAGTEAAVTEGDAQQPEGEAQRSSSVDRSHRQTLEEFKEELRIKREKRKCAIAELRNEILSLRKQLETEKRLNNELIAAKRPNVEHSNEASFAGSPSHQLETNISLRSQLTEAQFDLQKANAENLMLSSELAATNRKTQSLKDIIAACKEIIAVRETELTQLKAKFKEVEASLADREVQLMSENLRQEYDRQFANMRHLKALYEERARVSAAEKENLTRKLETSQSKLADEEEKNKNLEEHIASQDGELKSTTIDLFATREKLAYYKNEHQKSGEEMTVINQLFSQLLTGFNGTNDIDIDSLSTMLEENRDLLNDITSREHCKEGAAQLPKLFLDLFSQANGQPKSADDEVDASQAESMPVSSAQEISHNLPKVWKVLIELLNHQQLKPVPIKATDAASTDCYKSVETATGPKMVLSVSKTYLRLKDLILEKKFLQKETKKLKNLNTHLETRLDEQEQRLTTVTIELNKTWTLVGRMQRQHRQLHTSEQVLRYQLQQKRRMLNELKDELEYCRRKWTLAKEKNSESQSQWDALRLEFSQRKERDANNSAESGYSDSPLTDDDDEGPRGDGAGSSTAAGDRAKGQRIQSLSPVRRSKLHVARRNSDPHVAQFAAEVVQLPADVVQPICGTCDGCDANCAIHSVHFDDRPKGDQIKVTEAVVLDASQPATAPERSAGSGATSKAAPGVVVGRCSRRLAARPSKSGTGESLEAMFMRIAGLEPESEACEHTGECAEEGEGGAKGEKSEAFGGGNDASDLGSGVDNIAADGCSVDKLHLSSDQEDPLPATSDSSLACRVEATPIDDHAAAGSILDSNIIATSASQIGSQTIDIEPSSGDCGPQPSTSTGTIDTVSDDALLTATEKSYTERRSDRLKRLEDESNAFLEKMRSNNDRASRMQSKLQLLHERYGSEKRANEAETDSGERSDGNAEETPVEEVPAERAESNDSDHNANAEQ